MAECVPDPSGARRKERRDGRVTLNQYEGDYHTAAEFAEALRTWMGQLYQWQCVASSFPYFLAASLHTQAAAGPPGQSVPPQSSSSSPQPPSAPAEPVAAPPPSPNQQQPQQPQQQPQQPPLPRPRGVEHRIPPLWKRVVAECLDFLLLLAVKMAVTFAAVDTFDLLKDIEMYNFENLGKDLMKDYRMAFEMTSEILILELIHRIGTCVFEALCLHRGSGGGAGGATPGKKVLGLRVVRCEWVAPTAPDRALIYPSTDLGMSRAILRSVVKNFSLTFLFPVCFTLFSFQHNRTIYDLMAGSVVVEEQRPRNNNNARNNANN